MLLNLLNRFEFAMMNNPVRAAIQRRFEAGRLRAMGGVLAGGRALEIGCGRGVGIEIILEHFGAGAVDAFDLDPRMVARARARHARGDRVRVWVGDAEHIPVRDDHYDAVFDFGIVHHIPDWRAALAEVSRVLRPGGRLYAEEVLRPFISSPVWRRLLDHPQRDRFDRGELEEGLRKAGLEPVASRQLGRSFAWVVADKPAAP